MANSSSQNIKMKPLHLFLWIVLGIALVIFFAMLTLFILTSFDKRSKTISDEEKIEILNRVDTETEAVVVSPEEREEIMSRVDTEAQVSTTSAEERRKIMERSEN